MFILCVLPQRSRRPLSTVEATSEDGRLFLLMPYGFPFGCGYAARQALTIFNFQFFPFRTFGFNHRLDPAFFLLSPIKCIPISRYLFDNLGFSILELIFIKTDLSSSEMQNSTSPEHRFFSLILKSVLQNPSKNQHLEKVNKNVKSLQP